MIYSKDDFAVIFDMDGVIVDSEPFYFDVYKKLLGRYQLNVSVNDHSNNQGGSYIDIKHKVLHLIKSQHPSENIDTLSKEIDNTIIEGIVNKRFSLIPGIEKLLNLLVSRKIPIAIASSSLPIMVKNVVSTFELSKYFNVILGVDKSGFGKPNPYIFNKAAESLKISKKKCIVIEDSVRGIIAAKNASMLSIFFCSDMHPSKLLANTSTDDLNKINFNLLNNLFNN